MKKNKFKSFIKNNYHIILLALMFVCVGFVMLHVNYWVDDFRYKQAAVCGWKEMFQFLKWHFYEYNGRILVHFVVMLFLKFKGSFTAWQIACTCVMCLLCVVTSKLSTDNKKDFRIGCIVSILLVTGTVPFFWKLPAYWLTGSFNYVFPTLFLLLIMRLVQKKPDSLWIFPLSLIGGATTEQVGMMTVGFFVLMLIDYAIKNRKFNFRFFGSFLLAAAGYATIIFSPGTYSRANDQGKLTAYDLLVNLITIFRKRWIDNLCIVLLILAVNFFVVYCLVKYMDMNGFTKKVNLPLGIAVSALTVMNMGLKGVPALLLLLHKKVAFSPAVNKCIFVVWSVYAVLYFLSFFYATLLIYIKEKNAYPVIGFILGIGSQIMLVISEYSMYRTCVPGMFMFMIFIACSAAEFSKDCADSKNKIIKKYFRVDIIVSVLCVFTCLLQAAVGLKAVPGDTNPKDYEVQPLTTFQELKEFTDKLTKEREDYFSSSEWHENYDFLDFAKIY